jgi:hypothetical protein
MESTSSEHSIENNSFKVSEETVRFLLAYSRSLSVVNTKIGTFDTNLN